MYRSSLQHSARSTGVSCRARGGLDAERAERARIKEEAGARDRRNFEWMQALRREGFRKVSGACCLYLAVAQVPTYCRAGGANGRKAAVF